MLGCTQPSTTLKTAVLGTAIGTLNGPRQHFMRATLEIGSGGEVVVTPVRSQDSSLLSPLSQADCLIVRTPDAPAADAGDAVPVLPLDF